MIDKDLKLKLSAKYNLKEEEIEYIYNTYWKSIRNNIKNIPLNFEITKEEFAKLKTNFNIPYLGKLYCTYAKIVGIRKKLKYIEQIKNDKNKEN